MYLFVDSLSRLLIILMYSLFRSADLRAHSFVRGSCSVAGSLERTPRVSFRNRSRGRGQRASWPAEDLGVVLEEEFENLNLVLMLSTGTQVSGLGKPLSPCPAQCASGSSLPPATRALGDSCPSTGPRLGSPSSLSAQSHVAGTARLCAGAGGCGDEQGRW